MEGLTFQECLGLFAKELNLQGRQTGKTSSNMAPSIEQVRLWSETLFQENYVEVKRFLNEKRGLSDATLRRFDVGYCPERKAICIRVYDSAGKNVRTLKYFEYDVSTGNKRITTQGKAELFGLNGLTRDYEKFDQVIITEGELDAMVLVQNGFIAVSGTAGAETWKPNWTKHFEGKDVVVCYDSDESGRRGAVKVIDAIVKVARSVKNVDLFGADATKEMKDVTDYFVKGRNTATEFRKMIEQTKICPASIDGISSKLYRVLTTENETVTVYPAQDHIGSVWYYAVRVEGQLHLLTSDRRLIPFDGASEHGIKLRASDVDLCGFSGKGILAFLKSEAEVDPFDIFGKIKGYIQQYVVLKDQDSYSFLSLWTMGTYVFRAFRYYPYVHLNAPKQSGKTLLMEILAPICFNGQLSVNSTEAVLFRDVQNNSPTQFLDEVERFRAEDRDRYGAVMDILKTGYSRSGLVKRCGGQNKDKIFSYSTYSPKMLAGISDLEDVLRDRTIAIRMVRRRESEQVQRYVESKTVRKFQNQVRDALYLFGLTHGAEIASVYTENIDDIPGLEHLDNRAFDIWAPIILLANVADVARGDNVATVRESMMELSKKCSEERKGDDESDNDTVKLLTVLNQMTAELSAIKADGNIRCFDTGQAFEYFQKQDEFSWLADKNKTWLTRRLKKVEVAVKTYKDEGKTRKMYAVDTDKLRDYSSRYLPYVSESVTVPESVTLEPIENSHE
jgi:hypothetical protein